jgi:hypothetical protein
VSTGSAGAVIVVWGRAAVSSPVGGPDLLIMAGHRAAAQRCGGLIRPLLAVIVVRGRTTALSAVSGPDSPIMDGKGAVSAGHRLAGRSDRHSGTA